MIFNNLDILNKTQIYRMTKNWNVICEQENLDIMVEQFLALVEETLNEVMPIKSFTIKSE